MVLVDCYRHVSLTCLSTARSVYVSFKRCLSPQLFEYSFFSSSDNRNTNLWICEGLHTRPVSICHIANTLIVLDPSEDHIFCYLCELKSYMATQPQQKNHWHKYATILHGQRFVHVAHDGRRCWDSTSVPSVGQK